MQICSSLIMLNKYRLFKYEKTYPNADGFVYHAFYEFFEMRAKTSRIGVVRSRSMGAHVYVCVIRFPSRILDYLSGVVYGARQYGEAYGSVHPKVRDRQAV